VELEDGAPIARAPADAAGAGATLAGDWGRRLELALKDQAADLRRFIVASLESFASRIVSDVRDSIPAPTLEFPPPPARAARPTWPWAAGLAAACLIAVLFAACWLIARGDLAKSRAEGRRVDIGQYRIAARTPRPLCDGQRSQRRVGGRLHQHRRGRRRHLAHCTREQKPFLTAKSHSIAVVSTYCANCSQKLEAQGFHGVVKITSLSGLYCLSGNATDGFTPAGAGLSASKCDVVGNPFEESLSGQQRQSLAFANLIAGVRQRTAGAITVAIENAGSARPSTPYPARIESLTAGEWNRAAAANNRVRVRGGSQFGPVTLERIANLTLAPCACGGARSEGDSDEEFRTLGDEIEVPRILRLPRVKIRFRRGVAERERDVGAQPVQSGQFVKAQRAIEVVDG